jgi:hypothetical protein
MSAFDPFTATLDEAVAADAVLLWGSAQRINEKKDYYAKHPIDGVAVCVRYGLIAPDWLAMAFIKQYDKVLTCNVSSWDDAFGPAHPKGIHLSTLKLKRQYGFRLRKLFTDDDYHGRKKLPRTAEGREEAARILGITEKQVRVLLPKTRTNVKGHKPYKTAISTSARANDPFSLAVPKVPNK